MNINFLTILKESSIEIKDELKQYFNNVKVIDTEVLNDKVTETAKNIYNEILREMNYDKL